MDDKPANGDWGLATTTVSFLTADSEVSIPLKLNLFNKL